MFDINLTASIVPEGGPETLVAETNYKYMWAGLAGQGLPGGYGARGLLISLDLA